MGCIKVVLWLWIAVDILGTLGLITYSLISNDPSMGSLKLTGTFLIIIPILGLTIVRSIEKAIGPTRMDEESTKPGEMSDAVSKFINKKK